MKPDLLSILIGTNDAGKSPDGIDVEQWEQDYRFILDASRKANSDLRIVLLDPFLVRSGRMADPAAFEKRNGQIQRLLPIATKLASDYDAVHISARRIYLMPLSSRCPPSTGSGMECTHCPRGTS